MDKSLILIRGIMGSGKSTLAKLYVKGEGYSHLEADMFFINPLTGEYKWYAEGLASAHRWCQGMTEDFMVKGKNIVVSNTFIRRKEMIDYLALAAAYKYTVQEIICRGRFQNIHGIPEDKVEQKLQAFEL